MQNLEETDRVTTCYGFLEHYNYLPKESSKLSEIISHRQTL